MEPTTVTHVIVSATEAIASFARDLKNVPPEEFPIRELQRLFKAADDLKASLVTTDYDKGVSPTSIEAGYSLEHFELHKLVLKTSPADSYSEPPKALVDLCKDINHNYLGSDHCQAEAVPYCCSPYRFQWKILLKDRKTDQELVRHLIPAAADGHTYMLLADAVKTAEKRGYQQGLNDAVRGLTENMCTVLGIRKTDILIDK